MKNLILSGEDLFKKKKAKDLFKLLPFANLKDGACYVCVSNYLQSSCHEITTGPIDQKQQNLRFFNKMLSFQKLTANIFRLKGKIFG